MSSATTGPVHARNFIDGAWTDTDKITESLDPATGEVLGTYADGGANEARAAITAARRAFEARLGPGPGPARQSPLRDVRAHGRTAERASHTALPGERQDPSRGRSGGRSYDLQDPLLRRPGADRVRPSPGGQAGSVLDDPAPACRRRRSDRALELAGDPVRPVLRPGPGRRRHRRPEAAGQDRAHQPPAVRHHRRHPVTARGRLQRLHRVRQRRSAADRCQPRCGRHQLHRQYACRAQHHGRRVRVAEGNVPGAGRKDADDRLRRRRPGRRCPGAGQGDHDVHRTSSA